MFLPHLQFALLCSIVRVVLASPSVTSDPTYALHISENGRHFTTSDGQPFFWQADTAWLLFHRLNLTEAETYFTDRATKGYNIVLVTAVTQLGVDDANRNGDLPLIDQHFTLPNEPYWELVDQMVEMAWEHGIRIAFVPAWGHHVHLESNVPGLLNTTNAFKFGCWFAARYPNTPKLLVADTNSYWTNKTAVANNYKAGGVAPKYAFTDYAPVYDALAAGLRSVEGSNPQITVHCTNQWFAEGPVALASAFFGDRGWLSFDTSQSGHSDYPPNPPMQWWNARRGYETIELMYNNAYTPKIRPVLDNEPHYEARYINGKSFNTYWNASDVRIGTYQSVFSGAAGLTYGADNVMQIYIPGLFDPAGSGPARSWSEDIHLPGSGQMQFIKKVLSDRRAYPNLVPDQTLILGDAGFNDSHIVAMRDEIGSDCVMVYTPTGEAFTLGLSQFLKDRGSQTAINSTWYNPLDGTYESFDFSADTQDPAEVIFDPPSGEGHLDWVLVLEREA